MAGGDNTSSKGQPHHSTPETQSPTPQEYDIKDSSEGFLTKLKRKIFG